MSLGSLEIVEELVDGGLERRQRQLRSVLPWPASLPLNNNNNNYRFTSLR